MTNKLKIAFACNLLVAIGFMVQGLLYFFSSQFMPYHANITGCAWTEVPPEFQPLILALIRGGGIASFTSGLAIAVLTVIPFRKAQTWSRWAITGIGLCGTLPLLTIIISLHVQMDSPPLPLLILAIGLLIAGFLFSSNMNHTKTS